jgi:hypothetical protein
METFRQDFASVKNANDMNDETNDDDADRETCRPTKGYGEKPKQTRAYRPLRHLPAAGNQQRD